MSEKILKIGIAGYGIVGKRREQFINAHPNLEVTAVADKSFEGKGILPGREVRFYNSYKEMIEEEEVDIIFSCLSNDVAAEATCMALEKGRHVFCEKPPGRNMEDITRVVETEKKFPHLKLKYGFNHRYHDSIMEGLRIVNSGELGDVINVRGQYGKSVMVNFTHDWRHKREISGGGILLDQGIHMVDLIRLFAGEMKEVKSFVTNNFWNHNVEDNAYALMQSERGVIVQLHSTATEWRHRFNLQINCSGGAIIMGGILSGTKSYGQETLTIVYRGENDKGNPKEQSTNFIQDNSWEYEIAEFANCILNDEKVETGSSYDAFKTMELVYKIYCADPAWKEKYNISMS